MSAFNFSSIYGMGGLPSDQEIQIKNESDGSTSFNVKFSRKINEKERELIINVSTLGEVSLKEKFGASFFNLQKVKKLTRAAVPLKYGRITGELPTTQEIIKGVVWQVLQKKSKSAETTKKNLLFALNDPTSIEMTELELVKAKNKQGKPSNSLDLIAAKALPVNERKRSKSAAPVRGRGVETAVDLKKPLKQVKNKHSSEETSKLKRKELEATCTNVEKVFTSLFKIGGAVQLWKGITNDAKNKWGDRRVDTAGRPLRPSAGDKVKQCFAQIGIFLASRTHYLLAASAEMTASIVLWPFRLYQASVIANEKRLQTIKDGKSEGKALLNAFGTWFKLAGQSTLGVFLADAITGVFLVFGSTKSIGQKEASKTKKFLTGVHYLRPDEIKKNTPIWDRLKATYISSRLRNY